MSLIKENGKLTLVCDICSKTSAEYNYNYALEDFYEIMEFLNENGWTSKKVNGKWKNTCKECAGL